MKLTYNPYTVQWLLDRHVSNSLGIGLDPIRSRSKVARGLYRYHDFALGIHEEFFIVNIPIELSQDDLFGIAQTTFETAQCKCVDRVAVFSKGTELLGIFRRRDLCPDEWFAVADKDGNVVYSPKKIKNT